MAAGKKLTLKKLKRKSFWPSVIMFLVFATVSITLVFAGLQLLSNYILGARLSTACSQAMDTGIVMERCMNEKNDLTYAVNYVSRLGVITLVILLIPLIFLFINTVTNIYTQRATAKLLYTDAVTGGHNWIYFQGTAQKILEHIRNARRPYALVDLHLVHYSNYVNCYGSDEGENLLECMDGFLKSRVGVREAFGHSAGADFGLLIRCQGMDETEWRQYCQNRGMYRRGAARARAGDPRCGGCV